MYLLQTRPCLVINQFCTFKAKYHLILLKRIYMLYIMYIYVYIYIYILQFIFINSFKLFKIAFNTTRIKFNFSNYSMLYFNIIIFVSKALYISFDKDSLHTNISKRFPEINIFLLYQHICLLAEFFK